MNLSRLEKANQGFEKLKKLDAEIMQIEKMANDIANKKTEIHLELTSIDLEAKESGKVRFDADGSLINGDEQPQNTFNFTWILDRHRKEEPKKHETDYKETISDVFALQILGLLIQQKQYQRSEILRIFEKWGIQV